MTGKPAPARGTSNNSNQSGNGVNLRPTNPNATSLQNSDQKSLVRQAIKN